MSEMVAYYYFESANLSFRDQLAQYAVHMDKALYCYESLDVSSCDRHVQTFWNTVDKNVAFHPYESSCAFLGGQYE